ncbi:MAG TPA: efflux RND transporter periplasmic adaptor subunit [Candidatus Omnitrophota bacterium]|nr:efflux RND transporter periplasmic adaptor subunit [Candidatus Omnitrophota bacterium]HPT07116.1 efflux RND transporter periplasmic adaptor subunit [Candidatus Omnitrophota bacterium]
MRSKRLKIGIGALIIFVAAGFLVMKAMHQKKAGAVVKEITPTVGDIQITISVTGTVLPKNRLEVKPPVNGRVKEVLVQEGEKVTVGQTLALMSSTERAALLDAARGQGQETLQYWEEVYKPILLISPINGEVIVSTAQPGQTVTTADAVLVLSDQLIIRAQVDETDIGKVKLNQKAIVSLDAYPDNKIQATVQHIYYESETVNNVTVYKVDLVLDEAPAFFRSGMNATIEFIEKSCEHALLLPVDAVHVSKDKKDAYVLKKQPGDAQPVRQTVELGITDDKNYEIVSGLNKDDTVIVSEETYVLPDAGSTAKNPFMPSFKKQKKSSGGPPG